MFSVNDISFWQETADFEVMKTKSQGVILRAGQGSWEDKCFDVFRSDANGVIPFGTYWYYDNTVSPRRQAELYSSIIDDNPGELGAWLDLEQARVGPYLSYTYWYDFCEYFKRFQPSVKLGIYTRASYFNIYVPRTLKYFAQYPLWVAHYNTYVENPDMPYGWDDWLMWQWTDSGDGHAHGVGSREIDMNHYKGSISPNQSRIVANFNGVQVEYRRK